MPIVSNAAPDELDSPFYVKNEKLCNSWEEYILKDGGQINGKFNAWSFGIKSKVKSNFTWLIDIKKATYSSGNLLLSSKYQNLQEILIFRTVVFDSDCYSFHIRKSKFIDLFNLNSSPINGIREYTFIGKSRNHSFSSGIVELLREGFENGSLYEAKFKKSELTIVFHHRNDWFEMADRILAFDHNE